MLEVNYNNNYKIEDLGIIEMDVYDIEVKDNNNFFGNNILLHNSIFVGLNGIVKERFKDKYPTTEDIRAFVNKLASEYFNPTVKEYFEVMTDYLNTPVNTIEMDFEVIADKTIFTAKKKYLMNLVYKDGYNIDLAGETPLKVKGIEIVRTSTPLIVRDKLKELIKLTLKSNDNEEAIEFISKFKREFRKLSFEEVAFPRGVNNLSQYNLGDKSVPIHVRASKVYNKALNDRELTKLPPIQEGEKIKFAYIKIPNVFGENVIGCSGKMPDEIRNDFKIDYELQFEKTFIAPAKNIFNVLKWETEKSTSMASFFE